MQAIQHYGFYILAFVVALGALVAFHEFGHFWVARRAGVKVLKFSIGFGPKIAGRQIGETEYLLSAIPLGGYVKMLGEDSGEEISEADKQRSFSHAPLYKRFAIVAAGPVFNLLLAYLIFTAWLATGAPLFVPSFADLAPTVETVVAGSPAVAGGMKSGDKIIQIADKRINTWNEMTEIVKKSPGKTLPLLIERDGRTERLTILPGSRKETQPDGTEIEIGQIGITKLNKALLESENPIFAPWDGLRATWGWTKLTILGIAKTRRPSGTWIRPRDTIAEGRARSIACPTKRIAPRHGRSTPEIARLSVDFPAPFEPSTATTSLSPTARSMPRKISVAP